MYQLLTMCRRAVFGVALTAGAVAQAGTVSGTITFEGTPPKLPPVDMAADPACAAMHGDNPPANEVLVLGEGQTMGNILVWVSKGLPEGQTYPAPEAAAELTQKGCQYAPRVLVVRPGQTLKIFNPDGILHNVNGAPAKNKPFNRAMPANLSEIEVTFDTIEPPFPIRCDIHPWMRSFCAVMDHPYFDVTQTDGAFAIENLPAGEYEISAWHERLGTQTATVTVADDGIVTQDFTFAR